MQKILGGARFSHVDGGRIQRTARPLSSWWAAKRTSNLRRTASSQAGRSRPRSCVHSPGGALIICSARARFFGGDAR